MRAADRQLHNWTAQTGLRWNEYGWLSKMMVPFWVLTIIRHLLLRDPKRDRSFDHHPCRAYKYDYRFVAVSINLGVVFVCVLVIKALLLGVYIGAPDFCFENYQREYMIAWLEKKTWDQNMGCCRGPHLRGSTPCAAVARMLGPLKYNSIRPPEV